MARHPLTERTDIADEVVHFIRRPTFEDAFAVLQKIVSERRLRGGNGFIRGGYRCVCFTEAPLGSIADVVWRSREGDLKFQPFGIIVKKAWLFERGGRPVIYQPDSEYALLPENLRYRHVRYEPNATPPIDLTWEREWRIRIDELRLEPGNSEIVVLDGEHLAQLEADHAHRENLRVADLSLMIGDAAAEQQREAYPWKTFVVGRISEAEMIDRIADMGFYNR
jgi:hypothetical protein